MISATSSNIIKHIRFPLASLIVLQHFYTSDAFSVHFSSEYCVYDFIGNMMSAIFPTFVVPFFFCISGILFFNNINSFNLQVFIKKIKSRIGSLLIPYIIWNSVLAILYLLQKGLIVLDHKSIYDIFSYFIRANWAFTEHGFPIDGPLWYIRDLFIISLLSPIVYWYIKIFKKTGVIFLITLYVLCIDFGCIGLSSMCVTFFTLGAYFSIFDFDIITYLYQKINLKYGFIYIAFTLLLVTLLSRYYNDYSYYLKHAYIIFSLFFLLTSINEVIKNSLLSDVICNIKNHDYYNKIIIQSSFWIFAIHKPIILIIKKLLFMFCSHDQFLLILSIIVAPVLTVIISLFLFSVISKYKFTYYVTGIRRR